MNDVHASPDAATQAARTFFANASRSPLTSAVLAREAVAAHGTATSVVGELMVPMADARGDVHNLQLIAPPAQAGHPLERRPLLPGRDTQGLRHVIGAPADGAPLLLTTHYETAARLHEATGHACVVGFEPHNLPVLLHELRERFPSSPLACIPDMPAAQAEPALEAARTVGARMADAAPVAGAAPEAIRAQVDSWFAPPPPDVTPATQAPAAAGGEVARDPEAPEREVPDPQAQRILEQLRSEFVTVANEYFWPGEDKKLAFTDTGRTLTTEHDSADVARAMAQLARAKGWTAIRITGSEDFRRHAWLEASLAGLQSSGYKPDAYDRAQLEQRLQVAGDATTANRVHDASTPRPRPARGAAPPEQALREALVRMQVGGEELEATVRHAAPWWSTGRAHVGELINHGSAPFQNDPSKQTSYFVTLRDRGTDTVVWGADLARVFSEAGAPQAGDTVLLAVRQSRGPRGGQRNAWQVRTVQDLHTEARQAATPAQAPAPVNDLDILDRALALKGAPPHVRREARNRMTQSAFDARPQRARMPAPTPLMTP